MDDMRTMVMTVASGEATLAERHDAFEGLVLAFQDMAFACAYAVLGDFHLAEDVSQQAFFSAWRNIHQLREPDAFPGWFRRIVLTECSRVTRGKRVPTVLLDDGVLAAGMSGNPQKGIETDEIRKAVYAAIEMLPVSERIAVTLFYLDEQSHSDISAFLNVPMTTVAKRLYSARARMKEKMMGEFKKKISSRRPSRNASFAEKVRAGLYDEYVGRYEFELRPELVVTIVREGDQLISESTVGQRNVLIGGGRRGSELKTAEFDGRGKFIRNRQGSISHLLYFEFGCQMGRAEKIG